MLRPLGPLLVGVLTAALLGTFASAQSPAVDWNFEGNGTGWRASGGSVAFVPSAHAGSFAARLSANSADAMRIQALVPIDALSTRAAASAWFLAPPSEVARASLQIEAFTRDFALLARRESAAPLSDTYAPVEAALSLPPDTAYLQVGLVIYPLREGARASVDTVSLTIEASLESPVPTATVTVSASALPASSGTPTATPTRTPSPSPTPTPTATATRTATSTPSPLATSTVFSSLVNGAFEDPRELFGWSSQGGTVSTSPVRGGRSAVLSSTSGATKWLQQGVVITQGWYRASAWLRVSEGSEGWLRIAWYASGDASGTQLSVTDSPAAPPGGGTVVIDPSEAPPDARSARVRLMLRPASSAVATLEADDVRFEAVSPPLALASAVPAVSAAGPLVVTSGEPLPAPSSTAPVTPTRTPLPAPRGGEASADRAIESSERRNRLSLLRITEVLPDPEEPGPDADFEWVEIANLGSVPASLDGYVLQDNAGSLALPPIEVPAGGAFVLSAPLAGVHSSLGYTLEHGISNGLGNAGDRLALRGPDGEVVDAMSWGSDRTYALGLPEVAAPSTGHSIVRRFTDDGSFVDAVESSAPTPGDWTDSRALPPQHDPAHLATLTPTADRGWALLAGIAVAALLLAAADRARRVLQVR